MTEKVSDPVPAPFCTEYKYDINDGVLVIQGGRGGVMHTGIAIGINLAIDLHQKLGNSLAEIIRAQAGVPTKVN